MTKESFAGVLAALQLPDAALEELQALTPDTYIGLAAALVRANR